MRSSHPRSQRPPWRRPGPIGALALVVACSAGAAALGPSNPDDAIHSARGDARTTLPSNPAIAPFDLVRTTVRREGTKLVFVEQVSGKAGATVPTKVGKLAGSEVFSYVWPTSLDPAAVGFEGKTGTLALAATSHPDFDDTPLYDENGDGDLKNDGDLWHSHWVVLTPDPACGPGALKVRDIPEGTKPKMPATWPELPIYIDSPGYDLDIAGSQIRVEVPLKELGFPASFSYDGVTSALRVNASVHSPLLCVVDVFDVASGTLSLPGKVTTGAPAGRANAQPR